jgi:hypothetical protein
LLPERDVLFCSADVLFCSRIRVPACFPSCRVTSHGIFGLGVCMESSGHAAAVQESLQQAEFLAEDELVEISPMVVSGVVALVCGDFGPFEPSIATAVPLWLALAMKKLRRCRILPPRWLQLKEVERIVQNERDDEDNLQQMPRFFFQVSILGTFLVSSTSKPITILRLCVKFLPLTFVFSFVAWTPSRPFRLRKIAAVLLHRAEDDLDSPGRLRSSIRAGKLRRWMQANVRDRMNAIKINHLTSLEVESHRPVLPRVLDGLHAMQVPDLETDPLTQSTSAGTSSAANTSDARNGQRPIRRIIRRT